MCLYECVPGVLANGVSGRDTYSHTPNNANDEANKRRSGNELSTKDDP
jgi:hypothetical protein